MKYIVQCPECGKRNLKHEYKTEEFYCPDCKKNFDYELMHHVELEEEYILRRKVKSLIKKELKGWNESNLDCDTTNAAKVALNMLLGKIVELERGK